MLSAEHVDAFLTSAFEVLTEQAQARPERGSPVLRSGATTSWRELTGLVVVEGDLTGVIFYSLSLATAVKLAGVAGSGEGRLPTGGPSRGPSGPPDADSTPELGTAAREMVVAAARAIAVGGVEQLRATGCACTAGEAVLVAGFGEPVTEVSPVLLVPLYTAFGDMDIGIALLPAAAVPAGVRLIGGRRERVRPIGDREVPAA